MKLSFVHSTSTSSQFDLDQDVNTTLALSLFDFRSPQIESLEKVNLSWRGNVDTRVMQRSKKKSFSKVWMFTS